jgi:hypothetical protein
MGLPIRMFPAEAIAELSGFPLGHLRASLTVSVSVA